VGAWPENHWKSLLSLFLGDSSSPEEECRPIWEAGKESPRSNKTGDPTYIWHCSDKPVSIRERGRKQSSGAVDKLALKDIAGAGVSFESWWQNVTLIIAPSNEGAADSASFKLFNLDPIGTRGVECLELA
jgi:hypothetical protein